MRGTRETRLHAFGETPPPAEKPPPKTREPQARTVSEVLESAQGALDREPTLSDAWVRGEVSGLRQHHSGHWYFQLKDEGGVLRAAMFSGANKRVRFTPEDGLEVLCRGRIGIYRAKGDIQMVVEEMRPVGAGALALAFDQLRRRLEQEGLFDPARKRPLPEHPRRVGVVTSLQAAALRDVIQVATARHPGIQLVVADARVQGEGAAARIADALRRLDAHGRCDVIIVGRGGGSLEDLWAFNEEPVVRAVAACRVPVVSAVGHETDVTLCDFVADVRAATPSNAAELVVPDAEALLDAVDALEQRAWDALERLVPEHRQRVDDAVERAESAMRNLLDAQGRLLAVQAARLDALSPLATLARGYAVARIDGKVVRSIDQASEGSRLDVQLPDGALAATVTSTRKEDPHARRPR